MSEASATLKLDAIGRVVERLLRNAVEHDRVCGQPGCTASVEIGPLASELRSIIDAAVPGVDQPTEAMGLAMTELTLWAQRHGDKVAAESLIGSLLSEAVCLQLESDGPRATRERFLALCGVGWDSISLAHGALSEASADADGSAAAGCGEGDCSACEAAPSGVTLAFGGKSPGSAVS